MSKAFIDRNQQQNSNDNRSETKQAKIDPEVQLRRVNNQQVDGGWGIPAQMFAQEEEEEESLQAKAEEELMQGKAEEEELQMKSGPEGEERRSDSIGTKTVMPDDVRGKMENSFGTDFSNVNIHQNSDKASNIGALAYTQGNDIAFAAGQYQPDSTAGQKLLGHELAHVVQQRQGRVKPDAEQHKGMNINSDTSLEKEADVMGEKAAQGKMADVAGKGSGVQMKGDPPQQNISLRTAWGDLNEIGSAELRGVYYSGTYQRDGKSYYSDPQFIIIPSKKQWKDILNLGTNNWRKYIVGFLRAANEGIRHSPSGQDYYSAKDGSPFYYCDAYDTSPIPEPNIIEFLEVLFNVDEDKKEIDLPQNYSTEGGEFAMKQGQLFPELATFIIKHENLLVKKQSMKQSGIMLEEAGIERLVDQSVVRGVFSSVDNSVPRAIMDSSLANAFKETSFIISDIIDNNLSGEAASFTWQNNALRNYAKLIGVTVTENKAIIDNVNAIRKATIGMVIDLAFAAIPGGVVAKALIAAIKLPIKDIFKSLLSQSYGDLSSFITNASDTFVDVSGIVHSELYSGNHDEISAEKKMDIEQAVNILINTFTSNIALYA